jgi:hypothetical protein
MIQAVGIIADIVGSRELSDRPSAQRAILQAFDQAQADVATIQEAWATVGDEFQVITSNWQDALRLTLRVQVALPDDIRLRFGVGEGQINTVSEGAAGPIQDGTAWLHARAAIEDIEDRQQRHDELLNGFRADDTALTSAINAQLMMRDHIFARMKARERRLFAALLFGSTQQEAAREEKISQAAVSQTLYRSGAMTLLEADEELQRSAQQSSSEVT